MKKCYVNFEGEKSNNMLALCDPLKHWNGWEMPYIHESSLAKLLSILNMNEDVKYIISFDLVCVWDAEEDTKYIIEPIKINGETYYNFGFEGLCFQLAN